MPWPGPDRLQTSRYDLVPLTVDHATEMAEVLASPSLFAFTGGGPPTVVELRRRYAAQVAGAPDGEQRWLNWVLQDREDDALAGYVQATVDRDGGRRTAEVAWVVGAAFQGRGAATEAAAAVVGWLWTQGVDTVVAHIHPDNHPSRSVAARIGMVETGVVVEGEIRWEMDRCTPAAGPSPRGGVEGGAAPEADPASNPSWPTRQFSLANAVDDRPDDLPHLLRRMAQQIEALDLDPMEIRDLVVRARWRHGPPSARAFPRKRPGRGR